MAKKGIVAVALLVAPAGAGFAGYQYVYGGDRNPSDLAAVIPADAYAVAYISNEPEAWANLEKFGNPAAQNIIKQQITEAQQKLLAQTKMDFNTDIQPWLGNTIVAVLPDAGNKSDKPHLLIAIGIKDKLKALDFANKLKAQTKEPTKELNIKGSRLPIVVKAVAKHFQQL